MPQPRTPRRQGKVYYAGRRLAVTARAFRTPSKTFVVRHIEKTQLRRPAAPFALALAGAVYGFLVAFDDVIYPHERLHMAWPPLLLLVLSTQLGVLTVHSKALGREGAVVGLHRHLRRVRAAIDRALEDRQDRIERAGRNRADIEEQDED